MSTHSDGTSEAEAPDFRVGFSADFCDDGNLVFPDIGLALLEDHPGLKYEFVRDYRPEYSSDQLSSFDVLISLKPRVTAQSLRGVTRLSAIGRCGVGYDNVDLDACTEAGIAVFITPGGVVRPVAEAILLFVLALSHRLIIKDNMVRQGLWAESTRRLGREPRDRVVGTVGLGNIASEAVRLLRAVGVNRFLAFDPYALPERAAALGVQLVSLDELMRNSDYILINCPLTPQTRGLVGKGQFALMKPDAVLINTARGPIVDEAALVEALQTGGISGAALDVFEQEPLSPSSPLMNMENVILTSHGQRSFFEIWAASTAWARSRSIVERRLTPWSIARCLRTRCSSKNSRLTRLLFLEGRVKMNGFRQRLKRGELVLGQMVLELFTPGIGPMLEACGLDFVIYDMEHGRCNTALLAEMLASCRGSNIVPLARVPDASFAPLSLVLDLGAKGIMVPRVETRQQAEDIVSQAKYAPMGRRGVALGVAHDLYRAGGEDFFAKANEEIAVIVMLESVKAFENLDEIVSVPGVDVAWMGHFDLTVSMGIPAQFDHPRFLEAMDALVASCRRHGVAPGFLPPTAESAAHWIERGFRAISLGSDIGVFLDGVRKFKAHVAQRGLSA